MTVGRLEAEMSVTELSRWEAYEAVEPFMGARLELLGGMVCATISNVNRGKNVPAFEAADFMPFFSQEIAAQRRAQATASFRPVDEDDAQVMRLVMAFGGSIHG